jgi:phosphate transport system substrate-binding protein
MTRSFVRPPWVLVRVLVYVGVIAVLLCTRFGGEWRHFLGFPSERRRAEMRALVVAGGELAPELIRGVAARYARAYPDLDLRVDGGGTTDALESLLRGRSDVALLLRALTSEEQDLFRSAHGDTAPCFPIALGAVAVIRGEESAITGVAVDRLRALARDEVVPPKGGAPEHLYAPDPKSGLWDAFAQRLGVAADGESGDRLVFLEDDAAVLEAVRADSLAVGVASTLSLSPPLDTLVVGLLPSDGSAPLRPTDADVAGGAYPFIHYLYAACLPGGRAFGAMFLTQLTSDRGQRQIERAGFLPARRAARQIFLTTHPVGSAEAKVP